MLTGAASRAAAWRIDEMRQTIAVVDDEETIRETVAFALRRDGYDVDDLR